MHSILPLCKSEAIMVIPEINYDKLMLIMYFNLILLCTILFAYFSLLPCTRGTNGPILLCFDQTADEVANYSTDG